MEALNLSGKQKGDRKGGKETDRETASERESKRRHLWDAKRGHVAADIKRHIMLAGR